MVEGAFEGAVKQVGVANHADYNDDHLRYTEKFDKQTLTNVILIELKLKRESNELG